MKTQKTSDSQSNLEKDYNWKSIGLLWHNFQNDAAPVENKTATNVPPATDSVPAAAQSNLPEDALAQVAPTEQTVATAPARRKAAPSQNEILEKKADDFVEKYADEDLDVIDYEILDYFSEEDYITFFLES